MKEQIEEFIIHLKTVKNTPENTLLSYKSDLYKLSEYLEKRGILDVKNITEDSLKSYTTELTESHYAVATVIRQHTSIRAFFRYLVDNGNIIENPAENQKSPRAEKPDPRILTAYEIESLLGQEFSDDALGKRDKAILELMYATGLRVSELVDLKLSNVDMSLGCLRLEGERLIPYGRKSRDALGIYLIRAREELLSSACDNVFLNYNGTPMTRQGLWKLIKKYSKRAGISSDITPNDLRNSFGVHLLENGADVNLIQDMMGYSGANSLTRFLNRRSKKADPYEMARLRN